MVTWGGWGVAAGWGVGQEAEGSLRKDVSGECREKDGVTSEEGSGVVGDGQARCHHGQPVCHATRFF